MKANELRIGNTVSYNGKEMDVYQIKHDIHFGHVVNQDFEIKELNPIPLTEEWLTRFGFFEGNDYAAGEDGYWFSESHVPKIRIAFDVAHGVFVSIRYHQSHQWTDLHDPFKSGLSVFRYVHQLQNLYFGLIGEELKINQ